MLKAIKDFFEKIKIKYLASYGLPADATEDDIAKAKRLRREEKANAEMLKNEKRNKKRFDRKVALGIKIDSIYQPIRNSVLGVVKKLVPKKKEKVLTPAQLEAKRIRDERDAAKFEAGVKVANEIYDEAKAKVDSLKAQLQAEVKRLQQEAEEKATEPGISIHKSVAIRSKYAKRIDDLEDSVNEDIKAIMRKANRKRAKIVNIGECSGKVLPPRPEAKKLFYISMERRSVIEGIICVLPFIIGTLIFFAYPIYLTVKLSFGHVVSNVGFITEWLNISDAQTFIKNYNYVFLIDTKFIPYLIQEMQNVFIKTPLIIVFSLILAMLINKNIKGKGFFRVVFFLPFLLGTGQVLQQLINLQVDQQVLSLASSNLLPREVLSYISDDVMDLINQFFSVIVLVLWNSGVQILLFLSGLQSISSSLYEAARVDGATEWEMVWKITVPMISPIMLLNVVYTIVASFTAVNNPLLNYLKTIAFTNRQYEYSAAMGWVYFLCILIIIGIVALLLGRYVRNFNSQGVGGKKKHGRV